MLDLWSILGWIGAVALLAAYAMLSWGILRNKLPYHFMNCIGAIGIAISSWHESAYPATFLNVVWFGVAAVAIVQIANPRLPCDHRNSTTDAVRYARPLRLRRKKGHSRVRP